MNGATNKLDVLADEAPSVDADDGRRPAVVAVDALEPPSGCGAFGVYPGPLQRLANRHVFVIFFCLKNVFQGMIFTYLVGVQTSVERHFHFSSRQTGLLPPIGEVGPLLSAVLLSYLASHGNRPRWMGLGMLMVTAGMLVGVLSYLLFAYPEIRDNTAASRRLCTAPAVSLLGPDSAAGAGPEYGPPANATGACTIDVGSSNTAYFLWAVVYILCASGAQTIYVVSAPYMDDSVSQKNSPLFFALAGTARIFGPIMGYMLASFCISIYVDPTIDPGITKHDQRWVGAWWIGLLVIGALVALYGWLISLFPRRLSTDHLSPAEQKRISGSLAAPSRQEFVDRLRRLLKNPVLMGCVLSNFFYLIAIIGFYTYQPKYLEHQFRVNKASATTYSAISKVTLVFAILGSGVVLRRFRLSGRAVAAGVVALRLAGAAVFLANMFITCGFGDDLPGVWGPSGLDISSACSDSCGCTTEEYIPVCHRLEEGTRSYFSPCHAGCVAVTNHTDGPTTYTDCRCLEDPGAILTEGLCQGSCKHAFISFLVIIATSSLLTSSSSIPHLIIILRCVLPEDKGMALGLGGALTAVSFGVGPLITGNLVDLACLVWERSCGETGACWVYDPDVLRYGLIGFYSVFMMLSAMSDVFVFFNVKGLKLYVEDEREEETKKGTEMDPKKAPGQT